MIVRKTEHKEKDNSTGWIECIYESSNILMSTYLPKKNVLYISFVRGGVYSYTNISNEIYEKFESSDSQGKFFINEIKNNEKHPYAKEFKLFKSEVEDAKRIIKEWKEN